MVYVFWSAVALLIIHYLGYPLLMAVLARFKAMPGYPTNQLPRITLLISAYNEEAVIGQRLENTLALDYPRDKLHIMVVSDGSTDATHNIVEQYRHQGVELRVVSGRVGKTQALNQVIPHLDTDVVVFSDANSMLQPQALKQLVAPFADPRVGAVCGELRLEGDAGAEGAYWRYEKAIKQWESRASTLTVLNGALYALRPSLHQPMNAQAANDFQHPLQVALQGYRSVYQPHAVAVEAAGGEAAVEFRRRVRIISRGWRGLFQHIQVLNPLRTGSFSFQFIARKLLRWLGPVLMLIALVTNILLLPRPLYGLILVAQLLFYALAALGAVLQRYNIKFIPAYVPYYFCLINWAAALALVRVITGRDSAVWTPTTHQQ